MRRLIIVVGCLIAAGCESVWGGPPKVTKGFGDKADAIKSSYIDFDTDAKKTPRIKKAIEYSEKLYGEYSYAARNINNEQLIYDLPMLGAAIFAAKTLAFGMERDNLAGAGVVAGAAATIRTYVNPTERRAALLSGMKSLDCISTTAGLLIGDDKNDKEYAEITWQGINRVERQVAERYFTPRSEANFSETIDRIETLSKNAADRREKAIKESAKAAEAEAEAEARKYSNTSIAQSASDKAISARAVADGAEKEKERAEYKQKIEACAARST